MTRVTELDTPVVTIRLDIMDANIRRVQALLDTHLVAEADVAPEVDFAQREIEARSRRFGREAVG